MKQTCDRQAPELSAVARPTFQPVSSGLTVVSLSPIGALLFCCYALS